MSLIIKDSCYVATNGSIHKSKDEAILNSIDDYFEKALGKNYYGTPRSMLHAAIVISKDPEKFIKFLQEL